MSFDLCQVPQAASPFYIRHISTNIYSIEELCYYLYENMYLIDDTIVNERLCSWIRDELGMKRLGRLLSDHLEKGDEIVEFIMPIFRETGYLRTAQMRDYQEALSRIQVQTGDVRQKLKGDYLVRSGMYANAINEYYQILERQSPGQLGSQFYAQIWNNLGCAFARLFDFEQAASCFLRAWQLVRTKEMLRKYVSTLPLFLPQDQYEEKLRELGADADLIGKIQEYNARIVRRSAKEHEKQAAKDPREALQKLEEYKEDYRRSSCSRDAKEPDSDLYSTET